MDQHQNGFQSSVGAIFKRENVILLGILLFLGTSTNTKEMLQYNTGGVKCNLVDYWGTPLPFLVQLVARNNWKLRTN